MVIVWCILINLYIDTLDIQGNVHISGSVHSSKLGHDNFPEKLPCWELVLLSN
jgi:hypothetical protein